MADAKKSPFAELSFSEQQEQWRIFRSQQLAFQPVNELAPTQPRQAPKIPPQLSYEAPHHANLDRVRARLSAAAKRTGAFQSVTSNASTGQSWPAN